MRRTSVDSQTAVLFVLASAALANPIAQPEDCSPSTVCETSTNACGASYGGCYDECLGGFSAFFTEPSCDDTAPATTPAVITPTPSSEISLGGLDGDIGWEGTTISSCEPLTICIEAINSCGVRYGGCVNRCEVSALTPPPCTSTSNSTLWSRGGWTGMAKRVDPIVPAETISWEDDSAPAVTTSELAPATTEAPEMPSIIDLPHGGNTSVCGWATMCWDGINECGMWFGGCFDVCSGTPTFTPPPCPSTSLVEA
ncbi:hypothetical protein BDY21DRAFT_372370 [Lineolata rhizophorae]|uniref:Uncharacterized protein n=1 Tax=Lineolata rhizophorae TaxID=578093 RepID=A0A6A6NZK6_9PEZI|nr:hypothetical protein BDY21DRAFT_372370 [Lineolata rhizophorae]